MSLLEMSDLDIDINLLSKRLDPKTYAESTYRYFIDGLIKVYIGQNLVFKAKLEDKKLKVVDVW